MWTEGKIEIGTSIYTYWVKHYEEVSEEYGINGGRISKLMIKRDGTIAYNYDRGSTLHRRTKKQNLCLKRF